MLVSFAISKPEGFIMMEKTNDEKVLANLASHLDGSWENFPKALVIF
jgi:hypothetical protein